MLKNFSCHKFNNGYHHYNLNIFLLQCVYNHDNVIDEYKLKVRRFNSSFWSYPDEMKEPEFDDTSYFDGSYLKLRENKSSPSLTFDFSKQ